MNSWFPKHDLSDIKIVFIVSRNDNLISHYANSGLIFGNKALTSTEAYRCLVLLDLIVTFRLGVCRFTQFLSDISTFRCRDPKFHRCNFT